MTTAPFRVGNWTVCPDLNELRTDDRCVHLEPKAMAMLVALAEHRGQVVPRDALLASVWPNVHVAEGAVFRVLSELRRALGDDARAPRYIQTIPRRGYRLVAPVTPMPGEHRQAVGRAVAPVPAPAPSSASWRIVVFATAGVLALLGAAWFGGSDPRLVTTEPGAVADDVPPDTFARGQVWEDRADCGAYARARAAFEQALDDAPDFQPAVFHLIDSYTASAVIGCMPSSAAHERVADLLGSVPAPSIDVRRREASLALWFEANASAARRAFEDIGGQPDVSRAALLLSQGAPDQAVDEAWRAWREEPAELGENFTLAAVLLLAGRGEEARERFDATLDLYPEFPPALSLLAVTHLELGNTERALAAARAAVATLRPPVDRFSSIPALVLRRLGRAEEAAAAVARWRTAAAASGWVAPTAEAVAALAEGRRNVALDWISAARAAGDPWLVLAGSDPFLADLLKSSLP